MDQQNYIRYKITFNLENNVWETLCQITKGNRPVVAIISDRLIKGSSTNNIVSNNNSNQNNQNNNNNQNTQNNSNRQTNQDNPNRNQNQNNINNRNNQNSNNNNQNKNNNPQKNNNQNINIKNPSQPGTNFDTIALPSTVLRRVGGYTRLKADFIKNDEITQKVLTGLVSANAQKLANSELIAIYSRVQGLNFYYKIFHKDGRAIS